MRHIGSGARRKPCRAYLKDPSRKLYPYASYVWGAGTLSMLDHFLFFTELSSMPVYDVKGRRLGRVKDAALVPLVDSSRIDRYLVGGGDAWLTVRYDQISSISL
jgi:hypothetical protein